MPGRNSRRETRHKQKPDATIRGLPDVGTTERAPILLIVINMLPTWKTRILPLLGSIENEIHLRFASEDGESVLREAYSPFLEADRVDEVGHACADVAHELARRIGSVSALPMTVLMSISVADLVVWRLRDAQRNLRGRVSNGGTPNPDPLHIFSDLLIDFWHNYAEPYWLERLERLEAPVAQPMESSGVTML